MGEQIRVSTLTRFFVQAYNGASAVAVEVTPIVLRQE